MLATLAAALILAAPAAADDLIVRFEPGASQAERAAATALAGVARAEALPLRDAFAVSTLPGVDLGGALAALNAHGAVAYAEPDAPIRKTAVPNDRFFGDQWALGTIGAPSAWDVTNGSDRVTVAIVDGGIDIGHPDLRPNLHLNPRERAGNGRDDDGNGYVDDVHGYDFAQHDGTPQDGDGHGSHVSGIIGAQGNDGTGVAGVSWRSRLLALRVLNPDGDGDVSDAIKAYGYALRAGARVVNVSWGGRSFTRAERDMIADAPNVLFVASAGNGAKSNDAKAEYPCNHDLANVLCVGASDRADALAEFSNFGERTVDLAAPGVGIPSTITRGGWSSEDGTSMAAPHVSGAAALLLARAPTASVADLRRALLDTVDPVPALAGRVATGGRLNVSRAVAAIGAVAGSAASAAPPRRRAPAPDRSRPRVRILRATPGRDLRRLVAAGLGTRIRCSEACSLAVELVAAHGGSEILLGSRRAARQRAGITAVRVRLAGVQRAAARRSRLLRATLRVRATDPAGNVTTVTRRLVWRRR